MKKWELSIRNSCIFQVLGGVFLGVLLWGSMLLVQGRLMVLFLNQWTGFAGPEYVALYLGRSSRWGAVAFIITTFFFYGVSWIQCGMTLVALVVWELGTRRDRISTKWYCQSYVWGVMVFIGGGISILLLG